MVRQRVTEAQIAHLLECAERGDARWFDVWLVQKAGEEAVPGGVMVTLEELPGAIERAQVLADQLPDGDAWVVVEGHLGGWRRGRMKVLVRAGLEGERA